MQMIRSGNFMNSHSFSTCWSVKQILIINFKSSCERDKVSEMSTLRFHTKHCWQLFLVFLCYSYFRACKVASTVRQAELPVCCCCGSHWYSKPKTHLCGPRAAMQGETRTRRRLDCCKISLLRTQPQLYLAITRTTPGRWESVSNESCRSDRHQIAATPTMPTLHHFLPIVKGAASDPWSLQQRAIAWHNME